MAKPLSFGNIDLALQADLESTRGEVEPATPFRIALLIDFRNRVQRGLVRSSTELARIRPVFVDRDNCEEVGVGFGGEAQLPLDSTSGTQVFLRFASLDDFHPDQLCQQVEALRLLLELRQRLDNPQPFAAAAAELQAISSPSPPQTEMTEERSSAPSPDLSNLSQGDLLSQIIGEPTNAVQSPRPASLSQGEWHASLQKIVAPHLTPKTNPRDGGELVTKPCAETWLTERAVERLLDTGLMPLVSLKNTDVVRLARFQSLADPFCALAGRWRE